MQTYRCFICHLKVIHDTYTVVAIGFSNDKCCVLQNLLVQYLRKMFSHVSIEYWNHNKAHFIFFKAFLGLKCSIYANFPLLQPLICSQNLIKMIE